MLSSFFLWGDGEGLNFTLEIQGEESCESLIPRPLESEWVKMALRHVGLVYGVVN